MHVGILRLGRGLHWEVPELVHGTWVCTGHGVYIYDTSNTAIGYTVSASWRIWDRKRDLRYIGGLHVNNHEQSHSRAGDD